MRYKEGLEPALKDLSFVVNEGEHVAVVGRTGAGKSSLFQLLLGFRQPDKGKLTLDGEDITSLDLKYLRNELNVVLQ
jgi:ABC-type multidrug transport system fused ATPase/permease subunit